MSNSLIGDIINSMSKEQLIAYRDELKSYISLDNTKEERLALMMEVYSLDLLINSED